MRAAIETWFANNPDAHGPHRYLQLLARVQGMAQLCRQHFVPAEGTVRDERGEPLLVTSRGTDPERGPFSRFVLPWCRSKDNQQFQVHLPAAVLMGREADAGLASASAVLMGLEAACLDGSIAAAASHGTVVGCRGRAGGQLDRDTWACCDGIAWAGT